MKKLLLFDIDGTLLVTGGAGRRAVVNGLQKVLGRIPDFSDIPFSGRTDPAILRDVLVKSGCSLDEAEILLPDALQSYSDALHKTLPGSEIEVFPGVLQLLNRVEQHPDLVPALLTGNMEKNGYLKIRSAKIETDFKLGAFGSDHEDRNILPEIAQQKSQQILGKTFPGKDTIVIGDTPRDVECGRVGGAFCIAVATGRFSVDELAECKPDLLLADLSDVDGFIEAIL